MSGFSLVPFGVFITSVIVMFTHPAIRSTFSSVGEPDHVVVLTLGMLLRNMIPLVVICVLLALGLKFLSQRDGQGLHGVWKADDRRPHPGGGGLHPPALHRPVYRHSGRRLGLDSILADEENTFRAVELLGTIAMMLTGAFPMVTLIRRYLGKPLEKLGRLAGLEASGSVGLVACLPNGLAMFPFVKEMRPRDKVVCMAFLACGGYSLGDFLAFNVNFQPNLLVPVFVGRESCGGIIGILFAKLLAVPQVRALEQETAV